MIHPTGRRSESSGRDPRSLCLVFVGLAMLGRLYFDAVAFLEQVEIELEIQSLVRSITVFPPDYFQGRISLPGPKFDGPPEWDRISTKPILRAR